MAMNVKYPIFLREDSDYIFMLTQEKPLSYHLESNDVYFTEYTVWDFDGQPLDIYLENDKPTLRNFEHNPKPEPEKLLESIVNYASFAAKRKFDAPPKGSDPCSVLEAAYFHIKTYRPTLRNRIRGWFKKLSKR